jgi:S-DNA-T family DNA segregation ATPase FtsK/SpoIIIE
MTTPHEHDRHRADDEGQDHDNVVRLPVRRTTPDTTDPNGVEPDDAVVGEPLTAEESAELDRRMAAQRARDAAGAVVRVVRTGATHDRTRQAGRAVVLTAGYAVAGSRIRRAERRARRKHLNPSHLSHYTL